MAEELRDPVNIKERKKAFEVLLESPAWATINAAIQAQVDSLQQEILFAPVADTASVYLMERKKGMLEGRLSLAATVQAMLEELDYDLTAALNSKEKNDGRNS